MAQTDSYAVEKIFPAATLSEFNASPLVRSLTPSDFEDMTKAFSVPPQPTTNPKIKALTTQDLVSIDGLFSDYRGKIIANFKGGESPHLRMVASGSSCCCCCTPCCSCCSAASLTQPFAE
ncbi:hypothetical protein SBA4_1920014 [Candidatus Sulfopaludibacter sp. SbA4]|nr:hypothetical protein SBA4_1920014 [Candidatus Sulfopaludibacter sp. SbA4]